jgi:hypothetical protein
MNLRECSAAGGDGVHGSLAEVRKLRRRMRLGGAGLRKRAGIHVRTGVGGKAHCEELGDLAGYSES